MQSVQITLPVVTALYAGLNGLLAVFLAIRVSLHRAKERIDLGDGGDDALLQTIRVHANNAEYVALGLVLLLIVEMLGAPLAAVHALGAGLFIARALHAQGLYSTAGPSFGRIVGQAVTWLMLVLVCLYALYLFWIGGRP